MANYVTLVANRDYMKPVGTWVADAADGFTADDARNAEDEATLYVKGRIGWMYDISTWESTTPPMVELIARYLASAMAIDAYMNRDTDVTVGEEYMPDKLWEKGENLVNSILSGDMELLDASDVLIQRQRISPRKGPQTRASSTTFFPERGTRMSAAATYRRLTS